jgi:hypothetical protein
MSIPRRMAIVVLPFMLFLASSAASAEDRVITLASTTSTENSGLFSHVLPKFTVATGIFVRVVAVGTGQAIKLDEWGDADVLLVHDRESEDAFVEAGFGVDRRGAMDNDVVVAVPAPIPPTCAGWKAVGVDPEPASGTWCREARAGRSVPQATATSAAATRRSSPTRTLYVRHAAPVSMTSTAIPWVRSAPRTSEPIDPMARPQPISRSSTVSLAVMTSAREASSIGARGAIGHGIARVGKTRIEPTILCPPTRKPPPP